MDRRDFLKYVLGVVSIGAIQSISFKQDEGLETGRMHVEANPSEALAICGTASNCPGGGGTSQCGAIGNCSGGYSACGKITNCSGGYGGYGGQRRLRVDC